jgi:WD40 repeat protein
VAIWDVATLQEKAVFEGACDVVAFSSDGSALVTRGTNYFLRVFDVATQAARETIPGRPTVETDSHAALSPDGQILAIGLLDGTITFFDAKRGGLIAPTAHAHDGSFRLAFSPDGKLLAAPGPSAEPSAKIWDTSTHEMVAALAGHTDLVLDAAFSPDGKTLATSSVDDSIKFWDTVTWKEIPPSLGHKEYVSALAFSPNGRTLASACDDGTMKLWNVATRRELASLKLGMYGFRIAFSPDGQTLAVRNMGDVGLLRLWRAPVLPDKNYER